MGAHFTTQESNTFRRDHRCPSFLPPCWKSLMFFSSAISFRVPLELPGATKLPQSPVSSYSLHSWQEAPGLLWQALGSSHDVASTYCQVSATCSAWRRQIRAGRARKPLPIGRHVCQPNAELSKLQPFRLELPWNKSVQGMARSWQRTKEAQMEKKA